MFTIDVYDTLEQKTKRFSYSSYYKGNLALNKLKRSKRYKILSWGKGYV